MSEICLWTKAWRSGAAWVSQSIAQGIADAGGTITFIAPLSSPESREPRHSNLERIILGREHVKEQGHAGKLSNIIASVKRALGGIIAVLNERRQTRTFIISIPEPLILSIPLFVMLRLSGACIIFLVHDAVPHAWRFSSAWRWLESGAHGLTYRISTALVVLTPAVKAALVTKFRIDQQKIHVIPHTPFIISAVPPLSGKGRLLQFGTIRRNKCILEVIKAVSIVRLSDPSVTLLIAGEPHPHESDYWTACKAAMSLDPAGFDVQAGFVSDAALPGIITSTDAFILAYQKFDSQSGVAVLAGLAGRPVIGTLAGGLADLRADGLCIQDIGDTVTAESVAIAIASFRAKPVDEWRTRSIAGMSLLHTALSLNRIGCAYLNLARLIPQT